MKVLAGTAAWTASLGAVWSPRGTQFRVWAPRAQSVVLTGAGGDAPLERTPDGYFQAFSPDYRAGDLYRFRVDGAGPFPDPASRRQPEGVHGPSQVVDPSFPWSDQGWTAPETRDLVFYELHTGTFTPEGTFEGARRRLAHIKDLGATAVELMPVADFPGNRNWGYDGACLFAPARCYGAPEDLRRLVDEAHHRGLAVFLDVVYNHLGPDGNYTGAFSPFYFTGRHKSPWGAGVNLDGEGSAAVREFFIENACHWVQEYHMDGLRLDATHAIMDDSPRPFLAELAARAREAGPLRRVRVLAEDDRNLAKILHPEPGGWGLDGSWSDDLHHQLHRALTGEAEGYFQDFTGTAMDIAETLRGGWFYRGQPSAFRGGAPRGTHPMGIRPERIVVSLQNHDQVGNRALGERLHHLTDQASWRAATAALLLAPETPLLFMGQEWSASTPFQYFTDHEADLGRKVTEGRRTEFGDFKAFSDPLAHARVPDPQDKATFERSRLNWEERLRSPHAQSLAFHQALLSFRRDVFSGLGRPSPVTVVAAGNAGLIYLGARWAALILLAGERELWISAPDPGTVWDTAFTSEEPRFCESPLTLSVLPRGAGGLRARFPRPGVVLLQALSRENRG